MAREPFEHILVAYDGSENALRACEAASVLAGSFGSRVSLLYVIPTLSFYTAPMADQYYAFQRGAAESAVRGCQGILDRHGVKATVGIVPARWSIVETIVNYALDRGAGLIVLGARGTGGFEKLLVGGVATGVVAHAHCPVLVVK